jgi:hypothetical protein
MNVAEAGRIAHWRFALCVSVARTLIGVLWPSGGASVDSLGRALFPEGLLINRIQSWVGNETATWLFVALIFVDSFLLAVASIATVDTVLKLRTRYRGIRH